MNLTWKEIKAAKAVLEELDEIRDRLGRASNSVEDIAVDLHDHYEEQHCIKLDDFEPDCSGDE